MTIILTYSIKTCMFLICRTLRILSKENSQLSELHFLHLHFKCKYHYCQCSDFSLISYIFLEEEQ